MLLIGRRYDTSESVSIAIEDGCISEIEPCDAGDSIPWIAPGLVDLQINGYGGQEFNDFELTVEKVAKIGTSMDSDGITSYCPTATTHSFEMLSHALGTIAKACRESSETARRVCGIHLEGPYLSPEDGPRGAHPREHCRPPNWDEFQRLQEIADGRIVILTISPEYDGSAEFIARVAASGVLVAIGHTKANSDQIRSAVDAGARMSTHLGNGAHPLIRRHPNYIWDQLADDRLVASLIVDGHHLPPAVVKSFIRGKTVPRCVLVSDITGMAGMPPGRYDNANLGAVEVLENGRLVVAGQRDILAGAALPMTYCIANVMRYADLDLKTAIEMASLCPAQLIEEPAGKLEVGSRADLIQFEVPELAGEEPIQISATINRGELVYGEGCFADA